jgi:hypothetical protein
MPKTGFILNLFIYILSLAFLLLNFVPVAIWICFLGIVLNLWFLFKHADSRMPEVSHSAEKFDGSLIMEDLDREAARRREVEKFERN